MKSSLKALGLLYLLRTNGRMTLHQILEICTDGRDAVKTALQELRKAGLVEMTKVRSSGKLESFLYSLTSGGKSVNGSTSSGKSVSGGSIENIGFPDFDASPVVENPSVVTPVVDFPLVAEIIENESFMLTSSGKSVSGDTENDYIYNNKKEEYSDNNTNSNISNIYIEPKFENSEIETRSAPSKPPRKKRELKPTVLFRETEFVLLADGRERFREALIKRNPAYEMADLDYYYNAVLNWSDSKDNRKIDWIATAANFILGDERKGGFKQLKTSSYDNVGSKNWSTITDDDLRRAERLATRFGWKTGG